MMEESENVGVVNTPTGTGGVVCSRTMTISVIRPSSADLREREREREREINIESEGVLPGKAQHYPNPPPKVSPYNIPDYLYL